MPLNVNNFGFANSGSQPPWSPSTPRQSVTRMLAEVEERNNEKNVSSQRPEEENLDEMLCASQPSFFPSQSMVAPSQQMTLESSTISTSAQHTNKSKPNRSSWNGILTEQMMLALINDDSFLEEVASSCI